MKPCTFKFQLPHSHQPTSNQRMQWEMANGPQPSPRIVAFHGSHSHLCQATPAAKPHSLFSGDRQWVFPNLFSKRVQAGPIKHRVSTGPLSRRRSMGGDLTFSLFLRNEFCHDAVILVLVDAFSDQTDDVRHTPLGSLPPMTILGDGSNQN